MSFHRFLNFGLWFLEQELDEIATSSKTKTAKVIKKTHKKQKAASVHGDIVSRADAESPLPTR